MSGQGEIRFSVILPIYNVKDFLPEALACLREQTYENFEAILVDDCATDGSGALADQFVKDSADRRFSVIHQEKNQGVSAARNTGMQAASGDYILFLDPDDCYERSLLAALAEALEKECWDILLFGYTEDYYDGNGRLYYQAQKSMPRRLYADVRGEDAGKHREDFCRDIVELERLTMYGYPWNKAYRLAYLREYQIRFPQITHIEDIMFNIDAFEHVSSFALLSDCLYHYRNQGQVRLTGKYLADYLDLQKTRIRAFLEQQCRWNDCQAEDLPEETLAVMANFYFRAYQSSMVRAVNHGDGRKEILSRAKAEQSDPLFALLRGRLRKEGRVAKLLYTPLAQGKTGTAYLAAWVIGNVQRHFPKLYARWKQNR